jgi:hypothetical protein
MFFLGIFVCSQSGYLSSMVLGVFFLGGGASFLNLAIFSQKMKKNTQESCEFKGKISQFFIYVEKFN